MKRLLVHLHAFYADQVPYFLERLTALEGTAWDLYVTCVRDDPQLREAILAFRPDAHLILVENAGYDVWPFISLLRQVPLDRYDYVLKLHTKNRAPRKTLSVNGVFLPGFRWRNLLVEALLGSPERFRETLALLEDDPSAGMACCGALLKKLSRVQPDDTFLLREEMDHIGLPLKGDRFCAGTMFLARVEPFRFFAGRWPAPAGHDVDASRHSRLERESIDAELFRGESGTHRSWSPAHVYERILSLCVPAAGYRIVPVKSLLYYYVQAVRPLGPALQSIFRLDREYPSGDKVLTLFGLRFVVAKRKGV